MRRKNEGNKLENKQREKKTVKEAMRRKEEWEKEGNRNEKRESREREREERRRPEELRGPLASKSNHEAKCTPMKGEEENG